MTTISARLRNVKMLVFITANRSGLSFNKSPFRVSLSHALDAKMMEQEERGRVRKKSLPPMGTYVSSTPIISYHIPAVKGMQHNMRI